MSPFDHICYPFPHGIYVNTIGHHSDGAVSYKTQSEDTEAWSSQRMDTSVPFVSSSGVKRTFGLDEGEIADIHIPSKRQRSSFDTFGLGSPFKEARSPATLATVNPKDRTLDTHQIQGVEYTFRPSQPGDCQPKEIGLDVPSPSQTELAKASPCPGGQRFLEKKLNRSRTTLQREEKSHKKLCDMFAWLDVDFSSIGTRARQLQKPMADYNRNDTERTGGPGVCEESEARLPTNSPPNEQVTSLEDVSRSAPTISLENASTAPDGIEDGHSLGEVQLSQVSQVSLLSTSNKGQKRVSGSVNSHAATRPFKSPLQRQDSPRCLLETPSSSQTQYEDDPDKVITSSPARSNTPRKLKKTFVSPMGAETLGAKGSATILDIQAYERRVQILKRAVKIIREEDDDILEALAQKWREKGREIAVQLCTESSSMDNFYVGDVSEQSSDTREESYDENDEEEKADDEVGKMLKTMGVPLEALGWSDVI